MYAEIQMRLILLFLNNRAEGTLFEVIPMLGNHQLLAARNSSPQLQTLSHPLRSISLND